jgi:hypothetical protein
VAYAARLDGRYTDQPTEDPSMAKGQKRSGREPKKPKASKKPAAASAPMRSQLATKIATTKDDGK